MNVTRLFSAACVAGIAAASVHASPILYNFSFVGSGSLGGQAFANQPINITVAGDTSTVRVIPPPGPANFNSGVATIDIAGFPRANVTSFLQIYTNFNNFGLSNTGFSILDYAGLASAIGMWDLRSPLGPLSPTFVAQNWQSSTSNIITDLGGLTIAVGTASQWQFAATVPSPGCATALGLTGLFAARRRRLA